MIRSGLAGLALVMSVTVPATAQDETAVTATPIEFGVSHTLHSDILGAERTINVWLPPRWEDGETPYDVLYVLDGGLEQDYPHIAGLAQLGVLSWQYKPLIVVGIETKTRTRELTSPPQDARYVSAFEGAGGAEYFRRYIAEEVIPFIETTYRTGERRALMGESLAGLFVVETLLQAPDLFDDWIAISPSLWWDDQRVAREAAGHLASGDRGGDRVYLSMADEGGTMQAGLDMVLEALAGTAEGPAVRYVDRSESDTHSTIYHGAALDALRWLYPHPPWDYGPAPWYLSEDGEPPAEGEE
ncbi:alpha/beta hydrolase [Maricaulis sp. CAU 1757]